MAEFTETLAQQSALKLRVHSAGSSILIKQVQSGIRVDLIILADPALAKQLPEAESWERKVIATNSLAWAGSTLRPELNFEEVLKNPKLKIASADPVSAPLGKYSREVQEKLQIPGRKLLFRNASETLNAVAQGHADVAIVYRSDLKTGGPLRILADIDPRLHDKIEYLACLAPAASTEAKKLFSQLSSEQGRRLLEADGFLVRN